MLSTGRSFVMIKLRKVAGGVVLIVAIVALVLLFCSSLRYTAQVYLDDAMEAMDYVFAAAQCVVIAFIGGMLLGD
jgi:hypothetical protein